MFSLPRKLYDFAIAISLIVWFPTSAADREFSKFILDVVIVKTNVFRQNICDERKVRNRNETKLKVLTLYAYARVNLIDESM